MSFDKTIQWVENELLANRNDTIHDFLAYLAGQMIEMNKSKNEEIRGFLNWLEREIGSDIEKLINKTAIKEYHKQRFNYLLEVLKKNKKRISLDLSSREVQELLETHFLKSIAIILPLKKRIEATDGLIDEVVFRLYRLTDEEITLIKEKPKNRD